MVDPTRHAPVSAQTLDALVTVLADPLVELRAVAEVVETDPGLLSRTLAMANSAWYGFARTVDDAGLAVNLVGTQTVRTLAISGTTGLLDGRCGLPGVREHAVAVAATARKLAARAAVTPSVAFTAGLLHDLGELLLWNVGGAEYTNLRSMAIDRAHQLQLETDHFGTDHALLAAEHLFSWRLPDELIDAVGDHHDPDPTTAPLTLVVAAADELVHSATGPGQGPRLALELLGVSPEEGSLVLASACEEGAELLVVLA